MPEYGINWNLKRLLRERIGIANGAWLGIADGAHCAPYPMPGYAMNVDVSTFSDMGRLRIHANTCECPSQVGCALRTLNHA